MADDAEYELQFVLVLDCAEQVCIDRVILRGKGDSGRSDDNLEILKKRFKSHYNHTMPIIKYFKDKNQVHEIDTSDLGEKEVFEKIRIIFDE